MRNLLIGIAVILNAITLVAQTGNISRIINSQTIEINIGTNAGVKVGDKFEIIGKGQFLHPATGQVVESDNYKLGEIEVFNVNDNSSLATVNFKSQDLTINNVVKKILSATITEPAQNNTNPQTTPASVVTPPITTTPIPPTTSSTNLNTSTKTDSVTNSTANTALLITNTPQPTPLQTANNANAEVQSLKTRYDRSSLTMMMVRRTDKVREYQSEIEKGYVELEIPDKYDAFKANNIFINVIGKEDRQDVVSQRLQEEGVARELIAKWFNRKNDGTFDMNLITDRAFWNATERDVAKANLQARKLAVIADYGENLIANTFVLVNEITYFDKEKAGKTAATGFKILGALTDVAAFVSKEVYNTDISNITDKVKLGSQIGEITSEIMAKGFSVTVTSYLYKLKWNTEVANIFYTKYYTDKPDENLKINFNNSTEFTLEYVGKYKENASIQSTIFDSRTQDELIVKTLNEALDKNILGLQKNFEIFRVKTPLYTVEPDLTAKIGLKEGVTAKTRFDVLQQVEKNGKRKFEKVGSIKPISDKIWDNRYMAHLGKGEFKGNTNISATYFKKKSGNNLQPGMLLREEKRGVSGFYFRFDVAYSMGSVTETYTNRYESGDFVYNANSKKYEWQTTEIYIDRKKQRNFNDYKLLTEFGYKANKLNFGLFCEGYFDEIDDPEVYFFGPAIKYEILSKKITPFIGARVGLNIDEYVHTQLEAGIRFYKCLIYYSRSYLSTEPVLPLNNVGIGFEF